MVRRRTKTGMLMVSSSLLSSPPLINVSSDAVACLLSLKYETRFYAAFSQPMQFPTDFPRGNLRARFFDGKIWLTGKDGLAFPFNSTWIQSLPVWRMINIGNQILEKETTFDHLDLFALDIKKQICVYCAIFNKNITKANDEDLVATGKRLISIRKHFILSHWILQVLPQWCLWSESMKEIAFAWQSILDQEYEDVSSKRWSKAFSPSPLPKACFITPLGCVVSAVQCSDMKFYVSKNGATTTVRNLTQKKSHCRFCPSFSSAAS